MKNQQLECGCGGDKFPHIISEGGCYRKVATGSLIPTNFRVEDGVAVCTVNGNTITEFTLFNQRLYHNHPDGSWTLPKSEESIISIGDNW